MSEFPQGIWKHRTNKGRVVYETKRNVDDRVRKFFTMRDIFRITRKMERIGFFFIPPTIYAGTMAKLYDFIKNLFTDAHRTLDMDIETMVEQKVGIFSVRGLESILEEETVNWDGFDMIIFYRGGRDG